MHHLTLDRWSLQESPIHRLDARVKIVAALAILLSLALTARSDWGAHVAYFLMLTLTALVARLPITRLLLRTLVVIPFVAGVVVLNLWGGDTGRAVEVFLRSALSAYTALLLLATTPFARLLRGLDRLKVPAFFLMILYFVYRYLFLLIGQVRNMRHAKDCRAPRGRRESLFRAASGALAVLFARSYERAENVHRALLARGFRGRFLVLEASELGRRDWLFLAACLAILCAVQTTALWVGSSSG